MRPQRLQLRVTAHSKLSSPLLDLLSEAKPLDDLLGFYRWSQIIFYWWLGLFIAIKTTPILSSLKQQQSFNWSLLIWFRSGIWARLSWVVVVQDLSQSDWGSRGGGHGEARVLGLACICPSPFSIGASQPGLSTWLGLSHSTESAKAVGYLVWYLKLQESVSRK